MGPLGSSSILGLIRGVGTVAPVIPTFVLGSRMHLTQRYRGFGHFLSAASSSRLQTMVGGVLTRTSVLSVDLGVGGTAVTSGSSARPSHSCDWWVCGLGAVGASLVFGLVRGTGSFPVVFPTFFLDSRLQLTQRYRDFGHFLNSGSSSRLQTMVGGVLTRASALRVGSGVGGAAVASGSSARPSHSCD